MMVYKKSVFDFSERNGHNTLMSIEDEDVSGGIKFRDRPGGSVLYQAAVDGKIDGILADNVSRMFRSMSDGIETAEFFIEIGCKLYFTDYGQHPVDISTESGFMWFTMQLMMAHLERMKIRKRTKDSHTIRRNNGFATSHAPYGFDKPTKEYEGQKNLKLVVNKQEMAVVEAIFNWKEKHSFSYQAIANQLNEMDIKTKNGNAWDKKTVFNVIKYHNSISKTVA